MAGTRAQLAWFPIVVTQRLYLPNSIIQNDDPSDRHSG